MQMFGVLLISALMIVPVAASILIGKSFKNTIIIAAVFSEISILLGIYLSYVFELPSGSLIVILNILILVVVMIINNFTKIQKKTTLDKILETYNTTSNNVLETATSITVSTKPLNGEEISEDNK